MHLFPHAPGPGGRRADAIASVLRKWLVTQLIAMVTPRRRMGDRVVNPEGQSGTRAGAIAGLLESCQRSDPRWPVPPRRDGAPRFAAKALSVLIVYLGIQGLEANVLIPLLMKGRISLPPALTIVAQALMTLAFGFLGSWVAGPSWRR